MSDDTSDDAYIEDFIAMMTTEVLGELQRVLGESPDAWHGAAHAAQMLWMVLGAGVEEASEDGAEPSKGRLLGAIAVTLGVSRDISNFAERLMGGAHD